MERGIWPTVQRYVTCRFWSVAASDDAMDIDGAINNTTNRLCTVMSVAHVCEITHNRCIPVAEPQCSPLGNNRILKHRDWCTPNTQIPIRCVFCRVNHCYVDIRRSPTRGGHKRVEVCCHTTTHEEYRSAFCHVRTTYLRLRNKYATNP